MPQFSKRSEIRLATCDERLQKILREAIKEMDFTVLCGHRSEDEQEEAYRTGKSRARWPNSKHNTIPSRAVDIAPFPIDWNDFKEFGRLAGYIERIAYEFDIKIRWGGTFTTITDCPHFEIVE